MRLGLRILILLLLCLGNLQAQVRLPGTIKPEQIRPRPDSLGFVIGAYQHPITGYLWGAVNIDSLTGGTGCTQLFIDSLTFADSTIYTLWNDCGDTLHIVDRNSGSGGGTYGGAMPVLHIEKDSIQTTTGTASDVLNWEPELYNGGYWSFDDSTGVVTFDSTGRYLILINATFRNTVTSRNDFFLLGQIDTSGSWVSNPEYFWSGYAAGNASPDVLLYCSVGGSFWADFDAGDKFKLQVYDDGPAGQLTLLDVQVWRMHVGGGAIGPAGPPGESDGGIYIVMEDGAVEIDTAIALDFLPGLDATVRSPDTVEVVIDIDELPDATIDVDQDWLIWEDSSAQTLHRLHPADLGIGLSGSGTIDYYAKWITSTQLGDGEIFYAANTINFEPNTTRWFMDDGVFGSTTLNTPRLLTIFGATDPSFTWEGDTDTGISRKSANVMVGYVGTVSAWEGTTTYTGLFNNNWQFYSGFATAGLVAAPKIIRSAATTAPHYSFLSDEDTGIGRGAADILRMYAGGVRGVWTNIGLHVNGTASGARTFQVTGESRLTDLITDDPTRIVGADADGDLNQLIPMNGLQIVDDTLHANADPYFEGLGGENYLGQWYKTLGLGVTDSLDVPLWSFNRFTESGGEYEFDQPTWEASAGIITQFLINANFVVKGTAGEEFYFFLQRQNEGSGSWITQYQCFTTKDFVATGVFETTSLTCMCGMDYGDKVRLAVQNRNGGSATITFKHVNFNAHEVAKAQGF